MYYERCQHCGSRWQRPVEIERPFSPLQSLKHGDGGHAAAESLLAMLGVQDDFRVGLDGCDARLEDDTPCL